MHKLSAREIVQGLFDAQSKNLERYLARKVSNIEDARELAQEAFMRILRTDQFEEIRPPEFYLHRIATNLAHEHCKKQRNSKVSCFSDIPENQSDAEPSAEDTAANRQNMLALEKVLATLSPNVQASLIWHRRDGLTYAEIGERLGVSSNMVKKYLQTGVAQCRAELKKS